MNPQIPLDPASDAALPDFAQHEDPTTEVSSDIAYKRLAIVNVAFIGHPEAADRNWVLVDAGVMGTGQMILRAAAQRFGPESRPAAIVLTHGHFDHVGALEMLAERWEVPIYAHELEVPYLNGTAAYPPPDPTVGGGMMALLSPLYPRGPIDVSRWLQTLPGDGSIPVLPGWTWVHAPGHTPGQVALWREADRVLISADAFITTRQESAYAVAAQTPEMHGPPAYYTQDWAAARVSVEALSALEPEIVVPGHGRAMEGEAMRSALRTLAANFDEIAVPEHGRYVADPARAGTSEAYRQP
ncbi:MAG TPA: MBL fold metallo-hydrolase [Chthoniobacteraceae bacterium]|jgi:glyoxylase-like metal-dependent hydrolase (beta-lactamase superfamily II)